MLKKIQNIDEIPTSTIIVNNLCTQNSIVIL